MANNVAEETNQGGDTGEDVTGFSGAERKAGLSRCHLKDMNLQSELHGAVRGRAFRAEKYKNKQAKT